MNRAEAMLIERLVQARLASRGFLDPADPLHGYRVHAGRSWPRDANRSAALGRDVDALLVRPHGRFGKNVRQRVNAIAFARRHRVRRVFFPRTDQFGDDPVILRGLRVETYDASVGFPALAGENVLEGSFYFPGDLGLTLSPHAQYAAALEILVPRLASELAAAGEAPEAPGWVTIHVRSGDVFDESPDPYYGQPPLSCYQKVISATRARGVVLVHEDARNPVIHPLLAHCERRRIPVRVSSSRDFSHDLRTLLAARTLIAARGTLAHAVLLLSRTLERVVSFEMMSLHRTALSLGISSGLMVDSHGRYRADLLEAWQGSAPQRRLMLEYPARHLAWYRRPRSASRDPLGY